jgi:hypothetical protein
LPSLRRCAPILRAFDKEDIMIVWGKKGHIANLGSHGTKHCAVCEKERPFHLMLQYTVHHIWYVFRWVTGKQYGTVCEVCQRGDKLDTKAVESNLQKSPIPFGARWGWAFLAGMIAILAVFGALDDSGRSKDREKYLAAPRTGDRYVVNVASLLKAPQSKYMYGVLRVRAIRPDAVEFDAPTFFYSGTSGPNKDMREGKLDDPGYFAAEPIVLSRDEIARIHREHAIHAIERF